MAYGMIPSVPSGYCCYPQSPYPIKSERPKMNLQGIGKVRANPDLALVTIGVITENQNLQVAQGENSIKSSAILRVLQDMGIVQDDIQTVSYTVEPQYDFIEGKQILRGYRVANLYRITVRDMARVGEVLSKVVDAGANYIGNIEFAVSDLSSAYRSALQEAIQDAVQKAQSVARNLGVAVNEIPRSIIEESDSNGPIVPRTALAAAPSVPVSPGLLEVTAKVQAVFEYDVYR